MDISKFITNDEVDLNLIESFKAVAAGPPQLVDNPCNTILTTRYNNIVNSNITIQGCREHLANIGSIELNSGLITYQLLRFTSNSPLILDRLLDSVLSYLQYLQDVWGIPLKIHYVDTPNVIISVKLFRGISGTRRLFEFSLIRMIQLFPTLGQYIPTSNNANLNWILETIAGMPDFANRVSNQCFFDSMACHKSTPPYTKELTTEWLREHLSTIDASKLLEELDTHGKKSRINVGTFLTETYYNSK